MGQKSLTSNIWKLYLIKVVRSSMFFMPVIVLFFQENGLNMRQVFVLEAMFSVALLVMVVPSGYFADCFGRKRSIIIGWLIMALGFGVYAIAKGFNQFLAAEMLLGVGISFISGADSALLYDTLIELGRQEQYQKIEGRNHSIGLTAEGVSSILGGLLALISLRTPLEAEAALILLATPIPFLLVEPERFALKGSWRSLLRVVKYALYDHQEIKWIILYSSLVGTATLTMVWMIQPFLKEVGVPLAAFGTIWAVLLLSCAGFSWNAFRIEKMLGKKAAFILMIAAASAGYFLIGTFWSLWSAGFLLLFYLVRGINDPVMLDYLNGLVSSDIRATILSVKHLVGRVLFSLVGPLVGWVGDSYSLPTALLAAGTIFILGGLVSLLFMHKHKVL